MVGQGLVLWTPRGSMVRNELQKFISEHLNLGDINRSTPHIGKLDNTGHLAIFLIIKIVNILQL